MPSPRSRSPFVLATALHRLPIFTGPVRSAVKQPRSGCIGNISRRAGRALLACRRSMRRLHARSSDRSTDGTSRAGCLRGPYRKYEQLRPRDTHAATRGPLSQLVLALPVNGRRSRRRSELPAHAGDVPIVLGACARDDRPASPLFRERSQQVLRRFDPAAILRRSPVFSGRRDPRQMQQMRRPHDREHLRDGRHLNEIAWVEANARNEPHLRFRRRMRPQIPVQPAPRTARR